MTISPQNQLIMPRVFRGPENVYEELEPLEIYTTIMRDLLRSDHAQPQEALEAALHIPQEDVLWRLGALNNSYEVGMQLTAREFTHDKTTNTLSWVDRIRAQRNIKRGAIALAASRLRQDDIQDLHLPEHLTPLHAADTAVGNMEIPDMLRAWDNSNRSPIVEELASRMIDAVPVEGPFNEKLKEEIQDRFDRAIATGERYDSLLYADTKVLPDPCVYSVYAQKLMGLYMDEWDEDRRELIPATPQAIDIHDSLNV